jgi:hypothetical protein
VKRSVIGLVGLIAAGGALASCGGTTQYTFDPISHVVCTGVASLPRTARIEAIGKSGVTQAELLKTVGLAYSERVGVCTGTGLITVGGRNDVVITIANGIPAATQASMIPPIEHYLRSTELFSSVKELNG